jgi:simple sugar transport system ATP-binding protein
MVGPSSPPSRAARSPRLDAPAALRLDGLGVRNDRGALAVSELSLDVHAGEVFGIAGVDGNGQWELFQALAGLRRPDAGCMELNGASIAAQGAGEEPAVLLAAGMGYIPPDRRRQGAVLALSVGENALLNTVLLARVATGPWLPPAAGRALAQRIVDGFAVRCDGIDAPASSLSGGNLQRLIVGRTLESRPRALVAFNPTRGLDVAAARSVSDTLDAAVREGAALLLISTDLDEIFDLSDRVGVLYRGRLSAALPRPFRSEEIARLMAGAAT